MLNRKNLSKGSPFGITRIANIANIASDDKRDHEGQISHPHTNNQFLFLLTTKNRILCFANLPEAPEYAEMRYMMMSL